MQMAAVWTFAACFVFIIGYCWGQVVYDCPPDWASLNDHCYHFVVYPMLPYDEARQACHHDGANVVSVNTPEEYSFLTVYLTHFDGARFKRWYTSGIQRDGLRTWEGDGDSMSGEDSFWVNPDTQQQTADSFVEAHLVYQFVEEEKGFKWTWTSRTQALPYICEIHREEVYRIYQESRDFSYGRANSDPNTWLKGPRFQFMSKSTVFVDNIKEFSIECSAEGNPPPTYEWYKDYQTSKETRVTPTHRYTVTNGRFSISKPSVSDDPGTYTCVARNAVGSVFGPPILVAHGYLNEFSNDKPGARTAVLYQGAVIDCSPPNYNPELVFQWMKDGRFIRPEMNPHTYLSENGNLYFSEVQQADAAGYQCIATLVPDQGEDLASSQPLYGMSLPIELKIRGENANEFGPDIHNDFPAVFPRQPLKGLEMRLECLAYGRLPLYYSWQRVDGTAMPMNRVTFHSLNRVLHIREARIEDSGTYQCTVQGPVSIHAKNITVNVAAVPYFLFPLRDQHLDKGSQFTWVCDAVAIPRAQYRWYRDCEPLGSNDTLRDIQVDGNVLTITSADSSKHDGMYECLATNDHGVQTSMAQIRVLDFPPNFDRSPVEATVMGTVGGNVTIHCRPEAAPQPTISWTHNGSPVANSGRAQVMVNGNLLLQGLQPGDAGEYTCTAENSLGSKTSSGQLSVLEQTTLIHKPIDTNVIQNSSAHIPCQASYDAKRTDLVYVWYFNDYPVDFDEDVSYIKSEDSGIEGLSIVGAQYRHDGMYECRATTVFDSVSAKGYLVVKGPPDEPAGVHVHTVKGSEVTLWWKNGQTHGEKITVYSIDFSNNFDPTWKNLVQGIQAYDTQISQYPDWRQYVIQDGVLSPGTLYRFRVTAASANFGYSLPSLPSSSIKIKDAAPIVAPDQLTGGGGSVGMLRAKWLPLPPEHHGGKGMYYQVYYRMYRPQGREDQWRKSDHKIFGNDPDPDGFIYFHVMVGEDNYYRQYDVKVQGVNNMGHGPNTTVETIYSAEDIPVSTPQNAYAEGLNASAGVVYWDLPNNTREGVRGKVLGYQVNWYHWGEEQDREIIRFIRFYGSEMSGTVIGLKPNDDYWVTVQVFNTAGLSRPSGRAYLNTNYDAPRHYPDMVTIQSHGRDSVRVSWRGVSHQVQMEAPVSGYTIWYWPYTDNIRTAKKAIFGKVFSGLITGLEMDKIYEMRIMATSAGGEGKKTPSHYFTLGGEVRFDKLTSEVMASATSLQSSLFLVLSFVGFLLAHLH